jgi:multicomponent Na+:H+ antiporter subunit E
MLLAIGAVAVLFAFWLLLSGYFTAFLVSAGLGCAVATVLFASRMKVIDREGIALQSVPRLVPYWIWLLKEVVKSAWQVSLIIVHPRLPISPTMVSFRPTQKTSVGLVIHANSITLTPGTITVEADAAQFLVHALTRDGAAGAASGDMDARVTAACEERV